MNRKLLWTFVATLALAAVVLGYRRLGPPGEWIGGSREPVVPWDPIPDPAAPRPANIPPAEVEPRVLFELPRFGEGLAFDRAGNGYVSCDGRVLRFTPAGEHAAWAETGGTPWGHDVKPDGTHLVCDPKRKAVLHLDAEGNELGIASAGLPDFPLRFPNDVCADVDGGFYFTDPSDEGSDENPIGRLYHVDERGRTRLIDSGLAYPNGLLLAPDGIRLFVAECWHNRIHVYRLAGPGRPVSKRVFADLPTRDGDTEQTDNQPDGLAIDAEGNLHVGHWGMSRVQVLDPSGRLIRSYRTGLVNTANVFLAGPRGDQLIVTGGLRDEPDSPGAVVLFDLVSHPD
ncbi:MAG: SMP-30/gluconolactonase/LRE family protein [Planctomycetaceae bacterium]